jgi:hypothetical protein
VTNGSICTFSDIVLYTGNVRTALRLTNELLEILPGHQRAQGNKIYYETTLSKQPSSKRKGEDESEYNEEVSCTFL